MIFAAGGYARFRGAGTPASRADLAPAVERADHAMRTIARSSRQGWVDQGRLIE